MKIFIIGGSGRVGRALTQELVSEGHVVYAGARDISKVTDDPNVIPVYLDLHTTVETISDAFNDAEIIYFTAGSNGADLFQTEAYGAVKAMQAAEMKGIKRFILLSGFFATRPERWDDPEILGMKNYYIAKFFADNWLMTNTKLDYTILQPSRLIEMPKGNQVAFGVSDLGENSIEDVAEVLAKIPLFENTKNTIIRMASGRQTIDNCLAEV